MKELMTGMVKQVLSQERCVYMLVKSPEMISYCPASESLIHCLMFRPCCVALKYSLSVAVCEVVYLLCNLL